MSELRPDDTAAGDIAGDDATPELQQDAADPGSTGDAAEALPDLDADLPGESHVDLGPEGAVVDSLNSALRELRESVDRLERMDVDDKRVSAAEQVAESAAQLDEQIGSIARKDDT